MTAKDDGKTNLAEISHIEAAGKDGARYREEMTDDERRHYDNLILLCGDCNKLVDNKDNVAIYSVTLLKQWKIDHESKQLRKLTSNPSLLIGAINAISSIDFDENVNDSKSAIAPPNTDNKIRYNNIKRSKSLIREYNVYYTKINSLYEELEKQGSFKKHKLLRYIKHIYLEVKGKYVSGSRDELEIIQANADNIIEDIQDKLIEEVQMIPNYKEDLIFSIPVIMVDAFIRCKILEEPK